MAYCSNCGTPHADDAAFCPNCGAKVGAAQAATEENFADRFKKVKDHTEEFDATDISQNKGLAIVAYLGILVLIPLFCAKHSKFARFHTNQGLVVLIVNAITVTMTAFMGYLTGLFWPLLFLEIPLFLLALGSTAFSVLGIINAVRGKAKDLPFIGSFRLLR